ncbi:MAG: ABC transporter ATP-binding protein, partial [Pseudomonadota bacterium]
GNISYLGGPLNTAYRERVGIQFQTTALQDFQRVREALELFSAFYRRRASLEVLIEQCQLGDLLERDHRTLSGGQRQRLLLAIALVNDPDLVFLDEPTTGLDPQSRRNFWRLMEDIKAAGKTLVLTTHYMEEAQELCDEIAIVDHGRIIARGAPRDLLQEHFPPAIVRLPSALAPLLQRLNIDTERRGDYLDIPTSDVNAIIDRLQAANLDLTDFQVTTPTLEDLFLKLTGHQLRG